jgi:energy-coupling factor transport system permease protein
VLDRALDVAAALEVRGYGAARRPPPGRRPWSRHDLAFVGAASAVAALAIGVRVGGLATFVAYPAVHVAVRPAGAVALGALVACALAPFCDRRGVWHR